MRKGLLALVTAVVLSTVALPAAAIQCVPYAREVSGIDLQGDAWKWWNAAAGRYDRGRTPQSDAVMVFSRQGSMRYGHVSVVSKVVNSRMILVDHANWAPVRSSGRGAITKMVPVIDVSPKNDWSRVRVWYEPSSTFGSKIYRADGFVYNPARRAVPSTATKASIQKVSARTSMALAHMGQQHSDLDTSFSDEPVTQAAAATVTPAETAVVAKIAAETKTVEMAKTIDVAVAGPTQTEPVEQKAEATEQKAPSSVEVNDNLGTAIAVAKTSFGKRQATSDFMFN
ncbi:CHAP domain-containing protein [Magnetospirillum sp. 64-120]|uniref:CHAP domain-containing protein n=1 Tax=Magnetospirillum sp. 64-120 TaxID=1895778 RepID=UPI000B04F961|nr:CHAP domain-containing protein [Magnetospirillum sp. 64-120]